MNPNFINGMLCPTIPEHFFIQDFYLKPYFTIRAIQIRIIYILNEYFYNIGRLFKSYPTNDLSQTQTMNDKVFIELSGGGKVNFLVVAKTKV